MKEIEPPHKDDVAIHAAQHQRKLRLLKSFKPQAGHSMFKVDDKTHEITLAKFEEVDFAIAMSKGTKGGLRKKLIVEHGFHYVSALNKKNVQKWIDNNLKKT